MTKIIAALTLALAAGVFSGCAQMPRVLEPEAKATAAPVPSKQAPTAIAVAPVSTQTRSVPVNPANIASLQPFRSTFQKGEGYGVAIEYTPRDKQQFLAWLKAGKKMRVSCDILVQQMAEIHNLPFEGCDGAAAEVARNGDYQVVVCRDDMFVRDNWLVVNNQKGTTFGVWHRKCLSGETVLTYKGRPIISTTCGNVVVPAITITTLVTADPPSTVAECPKGFTLITNAWSYQALPPTFQERARKLIAVAERRNTKEGQNLDGYKGDAFSRTLGGPLRKEYGLRAQVSTDISVRFVDPTTDQRTGWLLVENIGTVRMVNGTGIFKFSEDPRRRIIETAWPESFQSPIISGGEHLLRLFPEEWGEECTMNVHGLVP